MLKQNLSNKAVRILNKPHFNFSTDYFNTNLVLLGIPMP